MKKISLSCMVISSALCGGVAYAGAMGPVAIEESWTGYYLGLNAGYAWSSNNLVHSVGTPGYVNPFDPAGAGNIANALAALGTNNASINSNGFIGGGQIGYNYDFKNQIVAGLEADIDGLTQSNSNASVNSVALVDFPENYTSTFSATKHVDYLGTVRGRLGYLFNPTLLLFGTGGFAYGGVSFNPSFTANESLGAATYPPVIVHNKIGQTRTGWTAGAGGEWMFRPNLTAKLEYTYYDLGTANSNVVLSQINNDGIPPVLWGTANVHTSSRIAVNAVRVGLNYHFS